MIIRKYYFFIPYIGVAGSRMRDVVVLGRLYVVFKPYIINRLLRGGSTTKRSRNT